VAGWRASRWPACAALLGAALHVVAAEPRPGAARQAAARQVFIVGDSTASEYGPERAPRQGWGMQLQSFLDPAAWRVRRNGTGSRRTGLP